MWDPEGSSHSAIMELGLNNRLLYGMVLASEFHDGTLTGPCGSCPWDPKDNINTGSSKPWFLESPVSWASDPEREILTFMLSLGLQFHHNLKVAEPKSRWLVAAWYSVCVCVCVCFPKERCQIYLSRPANT